MTVIHKTRNMSHHIISVAAIISSA